MVELGSKFILSQLCNAVTQKPNSILVCVNRMPNTGEVMFPPLSYCPAGPGVLHLYSRGALTNRLVQVMSSLQIFKSLRKAAEYSLGQTFPVLLTVSHVGSSLYS